MSGSEPAAVDEVWKRLQSHAGVKGLLVINGDGIAVRSTFDAAATVAHAALVSGLASKARSAVKRLGGGDDELRTLRVRSRAHELIVCPHYERGAEYLLVVVQTPAADAA